MLPSEVSTDLQRKAGRVLAERLRARSSDLERTIFTRIEAVSDPRAGDAEYLVGLREAVRAALDYALSALEHDGEAASPPPTLLEQARKAALNGVSLDTVLRRYLAGHTFLLDLLIREAEADPALRASLQGLLRTQSTLVDSLLAAVADEHSRTVASLRTDASASARRLRTIEHLLDGGDPGPAPELRYDFDGSHVALLAAGPGVNEFLQALAASLDRVLLFAAAPGQPAAWAWLGGRRPLEMDDLLAELAARHPAEVLLTVGEPGEGLTGWRLSHRQARAAWPIARHGRYAVARYADVALLASVLQDQLLVDSLQTLYLEPLEGGRDGGETLRETLRAYFAAERSAASASAALGVSRQTVGKRLRAIEYRLGRPLGGCAAALEAALQIEELVA